MERRTQRHLDTAERNRALARALVEPSAATLVQPPPLEWAIVAAFYAAVHYVNALLWERQRYQPHSHAERMRAVDRVAELRPASAAFARPRDLAYYARYRPGYQPGWAIGQPAVRQDLEQVARAVRQALSIAE